MRAIAIANLICNPASHCEIGMISAQLKEALYLFTKGNKKLRERTHCYIESMIEDGDFVVDEYKGNVALALDDADKLFFD